MTELKTGEHCWLEKARMAGCGARQGENMRAVGETIIKTVIHSDGHAASVPPVSITSVPPDQRVSVEVKQDHLFRYPSEWDPRETGKTKGGYLEGRIQLPKVNLIKKNQK